MRSGVVLQAWLLLPVGIGEASRLRKSLIAEVVAGTGAGARIA